jgi:tetratricopeptide (TPR) repeat protein
MVRPFLALSFLVSVAAATSPCAAQAPSAAAKECLRVDAQPADTIPWDQHERVYQQWVEVCRQAMTTDGSDIRIKKATARAYGATGRREDEIVLLREMAAQGDADSYMSIYEMYKSFYRSDVDKPQLVKRAEAEQSLRKAAELGHPFATMMLAILLDRGSTVKRDPEEAIVWAERAVANPARSSDPIKDVRPIDVQVLLGRLLVKSSDAVRKARGIALLERLGTQGRGDAMAYLAETIRASEPVRARALLEQGLRTYPGAALAPLADMLIKGEGGPKDENQALSLLHGRHASDNQYAKAYLGKLTLEGRLVKRDFAEAVRLLGPWSQWDYDTRLQMARILAEHPDVGISYPSHLIYEFTEASELGEPGALQILIALKLSRNNLFRDEAGGCKLVTEAANRGDSEAVLRVAECKAIMVRIRGLAAYDRDDLDGAIAAYDEAIKIDAKFADGYLYRGIANYAKKDFDNAIADYSKSIELEPTPLAYLDRGIAWAAKRDFDRAMTDYDSAIRVFHNYTEAYYWRGIAWKDKDNLDRAIADFSEAIRIDTDHSNAYDHRGQIYFYKGNFAAAAADFRRVDDLNGNPYAMLWLFLAQARAGKNSAAELTADVARLKNKDWPYAVIDFYLGRRTLDEMRAAAVNPGEKCEAAFYAGQWHLLRRQLADARPELQVAAHTCPKTFIEYSGAVAELKRLTK